MRLELPNTDQSLPGTSHPAVRVHGQNVGCIRVTSRHSRIKRAVSNVSCQCRDDRTLSARVSADVCGTVGLLPAVVGEACSGLVYTQASLTQRQSLHRRDDYV